MSVVNMTEILKLTDVSYKLGEELILESISLSINQGEYVGIIGPNGGGKTTLLRVILGLQKPFRGQIELFGKPIDQFHEWPRIGYLSQRASQVDLRFPISVEEVVQQGRYGRRGLIKRLNAKDFERVKEALTLSDVVRLRYRLIGQLSGGERQRVLIARALAGEPDILVLDEPLTGVDVTSQQKFYEFLKRLNQELGLTILFVSHDVEVLAEQATKIIGVNRRLILEEKSAHLFHHNVLEKLQGDLNLHLHSHHKHQSER